MKTTLASTRISTNPRLVAGHARAPRRSSAGPLLRTVNRRVAARRVGTAAPARAYAAGAALMVLVIAYLVAGAQATQTSYELSALKDQNAQLRAEQDQLRYQDARMHTRSGIAESAGAAGMRYANQPRYAGYQPISVDLDAPIGPGRPEDSPLWQRALAAVAGGVARDAQAWDG